MNTTPTFSFAINERTEAQRAITAQINNHYSLRKKGAPTSTLEESKKAILSALEEFKSTTEHSNPPWVSRLLTGSAYMSFGDTAKAIEAAWDALPHAKEPVEYAKVFNNLCEYYRQAGQYEKAAAYGEAACVISNGTNLGMLITWSEAVYKTGDKEKAEAILSKVAKVYEINRPGDILGTHLRFEAQLREMIDLPLVASLMKSLSDNNK